MPPEKEPFYDCPSYNRCSVNNCPLHSRYPDLRVDPDDKEKTCRIAKDVRVSIAEKYPNVLKFGGLTTTEFA